ncbi:MAG: glycosyltransferase [Firmicutes bacterium]|nr:glycosyltransferase [Bacillota bacterium]
MLNLTTLPWDEMTAVDLIDAWPTDDPIADHIDLSAASLLAPDVARRWGLLPFGWEDGCLCVATSRNLSQEARDVLQALGSTRLYRAPLVDIAIAQSVVYPYGRGKDPQRFGEIAVHRGLLSVEGLHQALQRQSEAGGRIGEVCCSLQLLTGWEIAEVLSQQAHLPLMELLPEIAADPSAWASDVGWEFLSPAEWRHYQMVPIRVTAEEVVVAVVDPQESKGRALLSRQSHRRVTSVLTGPRDVQAALDAHYRASDLFASQSLLATTRPEDSANQTTTRAQRLGFMALFAVFIALAVWHFETVVAVASSLLVVSYSALVGHRLWMIQQGTTKSHELQFTAKELAALDDKQLPIYTILIPARDEASMLPILAQGLDRLDYPKDRLDVKLLLEEDDADTIAAAYAAHLPSYIEVVIVPEGEPRTKPKACNYGLQRARGSYVTIFDAEDVPDPSQLKKAVLAFQRGDAGLVCVQAKLSYYNANQNLLTRWFTAEYAAWFDLFLPALHTTDMPIPLGGTSNHFRTSVLRDLGAWDPFNVTEDADLGIRLYKAGYRTAVLDSVTYEEANSDFVNWVRQRSRWIKGYLQTWLVHMRHPLRLRRQLGRGGFWGFQLSILGTPMMFILNPVYWFITSLWFMTNWGLIPHLFPPGIYYLGMLNLLVGNFVFTYLNAVGAAKQGRWDLVPYALLTPIYWAMMSLASWKAIMQLLTRPSHWEKTEHGLVNWATIDVPGLDTTAPSSEQDSA